jgi:hypothetical protein
MGVCMINCVLVLQSDRDVDFTINCSTSAAIVNVSVYACKCLLYPPLLAVSSCCWVACYSNKSTLVLCCIVTYHLFCLAGYEEQIYSFNCKAFHEKFAYGNYDFSSKSNTTIFVYVSSFQTPFLVTVSFVQVRYLCAENSL